MTGRNIKLWIKVKLPWLALILGLLCVICIDWNKSHLYFKVQLICFAMLVLFLLFWPSFFSLLLQFCFIDEMWPCGISGSQSFTSGVLGTGTQPICLTACVSLLVSVVKLYLPVLLHPQISQMPWCRNEKWWPKLPKQGCKENFISF